MRVVSYFPRNRGRPGDFARDAKRRGQNHQDDRDSEENMPPECAIYFTIWRCRVRFRSDIMRYGLFPRVSRF